MALTSEILDDLLTNFRGLQGLPERYRNRIADEIAQRLGPFRDRTGSTGPSLQVLSSLIAQIKPRTDLEKAPQKEAITLLQDAISELESEAAEASLEPLES